MFELTVFLIWSSVVASIAFGIYVIGVWIKKQAQKPVKRFFAPIPRPGSFSFVTLEGKVIDIIESVVGWKLKEIGDGSKCFVPGKKENPKNFWDSIFEKHLGVVWIGLFATIRIFQKWKWSEFKQKKEGDAFVYSVVSRESTEEEPVSDFFFQFPYPVITEGVEIEGNIQVKIVAVLTVLHLHPTRAFFLNKDPVSLFNAMIQSAFRSYVADKDFDKVKMIKASADNENSEGSFWEVLDKLNGIRLNPTGAPNYDDVNPLGLFGKLGFYVARAEVVQVEATGETAEALEAERIAKLKGEAEIKKAELEAQAKIRRADGDKQASIIIAEGKAKAWETETAARKEWVKETIVGPTGGAGQHVANVLIAEQFASPESNVSVLGANVMVNVQEPKKRS